MRGAIRFVGVLLSAAACGALGALLALPVALVTPEVVGWPLALAAGALSSSVGAFRAGKRFSSPADRGRARLLPIVGVSGTVTAVVAVVILGLMIPVAPRPWPTTRFCSSAGWEASLAPPAWPPCPRAIGLGSPW